jgi:hypothetical protein
MRNKRIDDDIDLRCTALGEVHLLREHIRSGETIGAAKPPRNREDNVAHPDRRGPPLVPVY